MIPNVTDRDRLVLRAVFWPRLMMFVGALVFLTIGAGISDRDQGIHRLLLLRDRALDACCSSAIIRSLGLVLVLTPESLTERGLLTSWEVKSSELTSWQLVRKLHSPAGYVKIVIRSAAGERSMSKWIVSGNQRFDRILEWLRAHHGSKESGH